MDANDMAMKLREYGFTIDNQGNEVYAFMEKEIRVSNIYLILECKVPLENIEKIGKGTFKITVAEKGF